MLPLKTIGEVAGMFAGHRRIGPDLPRWWRAALVVASVLLAYHYSLAMLARGATLQTPLAYLFLVPVISGLLAWARMRQGFPKAPPELRLDFVLGRVVGAGFIAMALALALLVPLDIRFWLFRADLLSLPFFVAGVVTLLFGVRTTWTFKFPIAFLLLAWPVPYLPLLGGGLEAFTNATIAVVSLLSLAIPGVDGTGSEGIFVLTHAGRDFALSIGSACSGVNSLVGFLLVGGALSYVVRGAVWRRVAWLLVGLTLVWLLNVVRILAILVTGVMAGEDAAIDVLHPVAGLVVFNAGVFAMLVGARRFGLAFIQLKRHESALSAPSKPGRLAVPLLVVMVFAVASGLVNSSYSRFDPFANGLSEPRLEAFAVESTYVEDWNSKLLATYTHAKPFFGERSTWTRTWYSPATSAALWTDVPVYVDVISTPDSDSLQAYGLDQCYLFHGYVIESQQTVQVAEGLSAEVIDYHNPKVGVDWSALVWEVPYRHGGEIWYERVVVFLANGSSASYRGSDDVSLGSTAAQFHGTDQFLTAFARELMRSQLRESESAVSVTDRPGTVRSAATILTMSERRSRWTS